jgi:hypothetical protein
MNKSEPKYKRGDTAYVLVCDDKGEIVNKYGVRLTCRSLKIARPVYDKEYQTWEYHAAGWASTFSERELSAAPILGSQASEAIERQAALNSEWKRG